MLRGQRWMRFLEDVALVADVDDLPDGPPDAVTLITLHQAKGLEFPGSSWWAWRSICCRISSQWTIPRSCRRSVGCATWG